MASFILLTLIFGLIGLALALYQYDFIAYAARDATRFAMVRGDGCITYANYPTDCPIGQDSEVTSYVEGLAFPGINPNLLTVTTHWCTPQGTTCSTNPNGLDSQGFLVKVQVTYPFSIPFLPPFPGAMTSTSQMVISN